MTGELSPLHPGVTADHDEGLRSGGRRLHARTLGGRSQQPAARSRRRARRARMSTRLAWIARSAAGSPWRSPTSARMARTSLGGRMSAVSITRRRGRWTAAAPCPCSSSTDDSPARLFRLTNPEGYSLTYNGLVMAVEKRRSHGWQAFGSYTLSRAYGLQPSSGTTAAGAQVSTVGSPPIMFGRDPNDLTNARGRLPNDRPHMFRVMGSADVPRTGFVSPPTCSTSAASRGRRRRSIPLPPPAKPSAARPARAARLTPVVVANAPRFPRVERRFPSAAGDASN